MRNTATSVIECLLVAGAVLDAKDRGGMTALDHAIARGRAKVATYLTMRR